MAGLIFTEMMRQLAEDMLIEGSKELLETGQYLNLKRNSANPSVFQYAEVSQSAALQCKIFRWGLAPRPTHLTGNVKHDS